MHRNVEEVSKKTQSPQSFAFSTRPTTLFVFAILVLLSLAVTGQPQAKVTIDRNTGKAATAEFKFKHVPSPARDDAATKAKLMMVDAEADPNSADISALTDGILPTSDDQPRKNFFLRAGSGGGRLRMDLGSVIELAQVNRDRCSRESRPEVNPGPADEMDRAQNSYRLRAHFLTTLQRQTNWSVLR